MGKPENPEDEFDKFWNLLGRFIVVAGIVILVVLMAMVAALIALVVAVIG